MATINRPDRNGTHRSQFERNKQKIYKTQTICGICGNPVDMTLKSPHPMSKSIDHIIPVSKGGHPSDIENLQLAHRTCNEHKNNKILGSVPSVKTNVENKDGSGFSPVKEIGNDVLPLLMDWGNYKP